MLKKGININFNTIFATGINRNIQIFLYKCHIQASRSPHISEFTLLTPGRGARKRQRTAKFSFDGSERP